MATDYREPFNGRYFGLICAEGDYPAPQMMFDEEDAALRELGRRRALPDDDPDWLSSDWSVLSCDVMGAIWNCTDSDPRALTPLTMPEIVQVHLDEGESVTIARPA